MITPDIKTRKDVVESLSLREQNLVLALAVIGERIRALPKEDREDVYELTKTFINAEDEEERDSAGAALFEVLEQASGTTRILGASTGASLEKWTSFIARRIKELRTKAGMTQEELSKKSGLSQSHISRLEAGEHSPNGLTMQRIAGALGIPASALDPRAPGAG